MAGTVKPIPEGYHAVTPYLSVKGAAGAIEFYKKAFGAKEVMRMPGPHGKIGHAEIQITKSRIMLADEYPEMICGDRSGTLEDPFGHVWHVSTHQEDISPEEMKKRAAAKASAAEKA